ncbi:MAG: prepilin peptidase [Alteromonadaceae bacterium]|nr:MAG: prepilin peptidase [Alteromonadaceae bacterium]
MSFDIYVMLSALVLGLLVGSFLNVVIYRLPQIMMADWRNECRVFLAEKAGEEVKEEEQEVFNLSLPRSHCPKCKAMVKAWQNIPIISYIILRGRCHHCGVHISLRYPIIELISGLLSLFIAAYFGYSLELGLALVFTWSLIALTMIDIDHQLLPDDIVMPLMWLGLLVNTQGIFASPIDAIYGAAAGFLTLWAIYWAFKLLTKKEGMGRGDFKLLAALGAWMGWQLLPMVILLSSIVGAVIGIAGILIYGKDKNIPIPFGPYLAIAGWIAFFWGEDITSLYLQVMVG